MHKQIETPAGLVQVPASTRHLTANVKEFVKEYEENGQHMRLVARVRWDDTCKNGHNTLSVTGVLYQSHRESAGGMLHSDIHKHFPELRHLLPYHLVSADGPLHYFANTTYLAGDRDCWGYRKDEQRRNKEGKPVWRAQGSWKTFYGETPPVETVAYVPVLGEGKERELDAARKTAIWPEATDEQLCLDKPELEKLLAQRLPALMEHVKTMVQDLGFVY